MSVFARGLSYPDVMNRLVENHMFYIKHQAARQIQDVEMQAPLVRDQSRLAPTPPVSHEWKRLMLHELHELRRINEAAFAARHSAQKLCGVDVATGGPVLRPPMIHTSLSSAIARFRHAEPLSD